MSGDGQLRSFIERILRLKEEQDSIAADIREVYAEAKGSGFDKTAMGQLVSHLRKVEKVGADAVEEGQTVFDLYLDAYRRATGTPIATHTHEAAGSSSGRTAEFGSANAGSNPAPVTSGELTDTQEQPIDPATQSGLTGEVRTEAGGQSDAGTPDQFSNEYAGTSSDENPAPIPNPQPAASLGADTAGDVPPPSSPATLSEAEIPQFLKADHEATVDPAHDNFINPRCKRPKTCPRVHSHIACYDCTMAWSKLPKAEQVLRWQEAMEAASETEAA